MYLQILYNFCYAAALLGLIHFWAGTKDLLRPYKPVLKFVAVKSVVFITFWQGLIISLWLMHSPTAHAQALQTWLLCVEMLPAAVVMWFAFPISPYVHAARSREQGGIMLAVQNVGNAVTFSDVVTDVRHQVLSGLLCSTHCLVVCRCHCHSMASRHIPMVQFKPQYNTYTRYDDTDVEARCPAPTGSFRHATYIIKDPFQERVIAESRTQASLGTQSKVSHIHTDFLAALFCFFNALKPFFFVCDVCKVNATSLSQQQTERRICVATSAHPTLPDRVGI